MYCPTCGLEHIEARRFCNRCGTNLEAVSRALTGNPLDVTAAQKLEQRQRAMHRALTTFLCGPALSITMLIVAEVMRGLMVPYRLVLAAENMGLFGVLLMFIGTLRMIHIRLTYGSKKDLLLQAQQLATPPQSASDAWPRPSLQSPHLPAVTSSPPPSVTENTTFRLDAQDGWATGSTHHTREEETPNPQQPARERG
jgi:hypothetical protein